MKKLPENPIDWSRYPQLVNSGQQSKLLEAALKLRIFDYIEHETAGEIAEKAGFHPRNTELFLNALAAMDVIVKKDGVFSHTNQSAAYLDSRQPTYLGDYLLHTMDFQKMLGKNIETLVRQGPPTGVLDMKDSSMWARSARCAAAYQFNGEAQRMAEIVKNLPEFPTMKRMLDIGGGSGFYTIAIVQAHPTMEGVILEQPAVADVAREFVGEYGMDDRITVASGDYVNGNLGGGYDLIFASATLNFVKNNFDELFAKIHDALTPNGVFITHQDGIRNERTKPANHITEFLGPELMGSDFTIRQGEIADAMLRVGFRSVRSFTKLSNIGEMDVDIARKG